MNISVIKEKMKKIDNGRYNGAVDIGQVYCEIPFPEFSDVSVWRPGRDRMDAIDKALPDVNGKTILDLGCGVGSFCFTLSKKGAKVVGVDIDKEIIEVAQDISDYYNQGVVFKCDTIDLNYLRSITEHYDYVLFLSLLHWICPLSNDSMIREYFRELERITDNIVFEMGGSDYSYEKAENATAFINKYSNFIYHKIGQADRYARFTYLGHKPTFSDFPNFGLNNRIEDVRGDGPHGHMYKVKPYLMVSRRPPGFYTEHYLEITKLIQNNPHPNIIRFYDSCIDSGYFYGLMEYVHGVSPSSIPFVERPMDDIRNTYDRIFEYLDKFNILHRDTNATNLIWNKEVGTIILIDWAESTWLDNPCKPILTSHYMGMVSPMTRDFDRYLSNFVFKEGGMSYDVVRRYLSDNVKYDEVQRCYHITMGSLGSMLDCIPVLYDLAIRITAKNVVELGTDSGSSTISLLAACGSNGGYLHSFDWVDCPIARENVKKYGLGDMWTFTVMDDLEAAKQWKGGPIDFLFIDTDHKYEQTMKELDVWVPLVRSGGYITFHDVISRKDEVQKAIDEYVQVHQDTIDSYEVVVRDSYGLGLMIKK